MVNAVLQEALQFLLMKAVGGVGAVASIHKEGDAQSALSSLLQPIDTAIPQVKRGRALGIEYEARMLCPMV